MITAGVMGTVPARADSGGSTPSPGAVIASSPAEPAPAAGTATVRVIGVDYLPSGLLVSGHAGRTVTVSTKGQKPRTVRPSSSRVPARFTGLTAGRSYAVTVGGHRVATATVLTRPAPVRDLTVRTAIDPGSVLLTWAYTPTTRSGRVTFRATATPVTGQGASASAATVTGVAAGSARELVLPGVDPHTLYRLSVAATNPTGAGRAASAVLTRTLGDLTGADAAAQAAAEAAAQAAAAKAEADRNAAEAAAAAKPAPSSSGGGSRTIYTCPDGYLDAGSDCTKTLAYTFHDETVTQAYTYHTETTGPAPMLDSYTTDNVCPGGYNLEDYGWVKYCRRYGTAPTAQVKDATPDGYTDSGSAWTKTVHVKDATPTGYTDSGTAWVTRTAKTAHTVPA